MIIIISDNSYNIVIISTPLSSFFSISLTPPPITTIGTKTTKTTKAKTTATAPPHISEICYLIF